MVYLANNALTLFINNALWLLTRLTYLAGGPDGVKCILIGMFSSRSDGGRREEEEDVLRGEEEGKGRHNIYIVGETVFSPTI